MTSRRDRLLASWWLVLTLVPFGQFAWIPLVYMGTRAKRRGWTRFGIGYLVAQTVAWPIFGSSPDDSTQEWASFAVIMASWVAAFGHSLVVRSAYLDATFPRHPGLERAEARADLRERARRLAREDPQRAVELGVGRPDLPHAFDGEVVDLNNAPVAVIETLAGVNAELAARIVRVREEVHGFESLEDAAALLDLPAPLVDRIRRDVVVLPRGFETAG